MPVLSLQRVYAGYRPDMPVIRGVDLELAPGEFLGLIGPNGCGKSTLLRAITGVIPVVAGRILVDGRATAALTRRALARLLAVVPQDSGTQFAFTVREIVMMGRHPYMGRFRGPDRRDEAAADEAMRLTRTQELAPRSMAELSGGERQRVIIARALAQQPRVLLLDEPTNHLDINHQIEILDLLFTLSRTRELAILCVTHDLNFASEYSDRLLLMDQGKIVASGRPADVLTAQRIHDVYGVEARIEAGWPVAGPRIVPITGKARTVLAHEEA